MAAESNSKPQESKDLQLIVRDGNISWSVRHRKFSNTIFEGGFRFLNKAVAEYNSI